MSSSRITPSWALTFVFALVGTLAMGAITSGCSAKGGPGGLPTFNPTTNFTPTSYDGTYNGTISGNGSGGPITTALTIHVVNNQIVSTNGQLVTGSPATITDSNISGESSLVTWTVNNITLTGNFHTGTALGNTAGGSWRITGGGQTGGGSWQARQ